MAARQTNLVDFNGPQFGGPYAIHGLALDAIGAAPFDGCWVPMFGAKYATLELTGLMDTLGVDVYGSNSLEDPGNGYTLTLAGSETNGDVVALVISNPNLLGGSVTISHTASGGEAVAAIAAALAAGINLNAGLNGIGLKATVAAAVITVRYPSFGPQTGNGNPSQAAVANPTTVAYTQGGNSETIAIAVLTTGTKLGSTLAAFGLTAVTAVPRWIKARLTTLTGAGANVSARFSGAA